MTGTQFHTRRLELPKGWLEIRGEFNAFDLDDDQRALLSMMVDWFTEFERKYPAAAPKPTEQFIKAEEARA